MNEAQVASLQSQLATTDRVNCALMGENARLLDALEGLIADAAATYEACKSGQPVITTGQFGRLQTARDVLAKARP